MQQPPLSRYGRLAATLIAVWFASSLTASALQVFKAGVIFSTPLPLGLAVLVPITVFLTWFARSPGFREFALSLNPRALTLIHSWRTVGIVFLVLYTYGILPGTFALPAGWGDIAIGLTAPLVARYIAEPGHRRLFIAWQALGILDLVVAIIMGVLSSSTSFGIVTHGPTNAPMSVLPLSLIPTFAVPLLLILHIISIAQARRWQEAATLEASVAIG